MMHANISQMLTYEVQGGAVDCGGMNGLGQDGHCGHSVGMKGGAVLLEGVARAVSPSG